MSAPFVDRAKPVRAGEELVTAGVASFLRDHLPHLAGELRVTQYPSGFSNLTYLLTFDDRTFVLRRPPFGKKAKTAHDMSREYRVLAALHPVFPQAPRPVAYTDDETLIGAPFYVMERVEGIILRANPPKGFELSADSARRLCERFVEVWAKLHEVDYAAIGLGDFGKPQGYVRRQVEGWSRRYRDARTPDAPGCEEVMAWIGANQPPDTTHPCLIHNDYKFDNVVLDPQTLDVIGVLDWEMATIGDPMMDLGSSLAYWVQADDPDEQLMTRWLPTHLPGMFTRRELCEAWSARTGRALHDLEFYYVFGLFRLGVIAQQIYYRFFHGQTKDARFAMLVHVVKMLDDAARRVIAGGGV
ncbi:phosphotransferase family protein [bacterium]|nr:phosphotransferase family protein [bacterium]